MSEQACAAEAASCEKRPVRIDDFASYQYVGALRVTKDGKRLVYALSSVNMEKNRYECDLWDARPGERLLSSAHELGQGRGTSTCSTMVTCSSCQAVARRRRREEGRRPRQAR